MLTLQVKIDASPMAYDDESVKAAIEAAIKAAIPCQLYSLEVNVVENASQVQG